MGMGTHEALGCSSRAAQRMRAAVLPCSTAGRAPVVTGMGGRWPQMAGQGLSLAPACAFDCCAAPPADRLLLGRLAELLLLLPDCGAMKQRLLEQLLPSPSWKSPMPSIFSPEPGAPCSTASRAPMAAAPSGCTAKREAGWAASPADQVVSLRAHAAVRAIQGGSWELKQLARKNSRWVWASGRVGGHHAISSDPLCCVFVPRSNTAHLFAPG